jgi:hypothetical protein
MTVLSLTGLTDEASTKQWKTQLKKWDCKRNINQKDAAQILQLYVNARKQRIHRKVFFLGKEKSLKAIQAYIRKSDSLRSENDLLGKLVDLELPDYITYEDYAPSTGASMLAAPAFTLSSSENSASHSGAVNSSPRLGAGSTRETPGTSFTSSPVWIGSNQGSSPDMELFSQWEPLGASAIDTPEPSMMAMNDDDEDHSMMHEGLDLDPLFETFPVDDAQIGAINAFGLVQPLGLQASGKPIHLSALFNALLSVTPAQTVKQFAHTQPIFRDLKVALSTIMGPGPDTEQLSHLTHSRNFLVHCIQGCFEDGVERPQDAAATFETAMDHFDMMVLNETEECLSTLSSMLTIFECYGQRSTTRRILEAAQRRLHVSTEQETNLLLMETIAFMLQSQHPDHGRSAKYNVESLRRIRQRFFERPHGHESKLTLAATFHVGWAELENRNYSIAKGIFLELKPTMEVILGPCHIQTIMTSACLARAHLRCEEHQPAYRLIEETVVNRITQVFADSHPYYWEARRRQASFMVALSDHTRDPSLRQQYRVKAEAILREVIQWRFVILGPSNPLTAATYRSLKTLIEKEPKRTQEADTLDEWCERSFQQQRQELLAHNFVRAGH